MNRKHAHIRRGKIEMDLVRVLQCWRCGLWLDHRKEFHIHIVMYMAVALVIHGCHPRTQPPGMCERPLSCTHTCSAQKQRSDLKTPTPHLQRPPPPPLLSHMELNLAACRVRTAGSFSIAFRIYGFFFFSFFTRQRSQRLMEVCAMLKKRREALACFLFLFFLPMSSC